ncbi:hypothetical protein ACR77J_07110 [Tissierella praeacuta]|uniref:hypothetical protein n=1 Tax=Tissierella praeacuta TaxID=43131 RepID=UPI003DA413CA
MFYEGCTLDEIRAFRELEGEVFNFGEGEMKMEGWYGSEDAYYEMCLPEESGFNYEMKEYCHFKPKLKQKHKHRLNHYYRKKIDKRKLNRLKGIRWWTVSDRGTHKIRCYLSSRRAVVKKMANKKVRKYKDVGNGSNYRKTYDYWWQIL